MNADLKMALGGIGGLIVLYLVVSNATNFAKVTNSIASSSANVISTLQGRGGSSSFATLGTVTNA